MTAPRGWTTVASLSLAEAAAVAGVGRSTMYAWATEGRIRLIRDHLGDKRVRPADLQALLAVEGEQANLFSGATP